MKTEYIQAYADRLEKMNAQDFTQEIKGLPLDLMLELALKRTKIQCFRGESMWDRNMTIQEESINYFELAKFLQQRKGDEEF